MDFETGTLLILLLQLSITHSEHVFGTINVNTTFFYQKLPITPAISTTIEFSISYLKSSMRDKFPLMGLHTEYPEINIAKGCTYIRYGQLRNENLHPYLRVGRYRTTTCELSGSDTVSCRGKVTVQDYLPRNFHLTFGSPCTWSHFSPLQGLSYNISFTKQSNETSECTDYSGFFGSGVCSKFYKETSLPNFIGDESIYPYKEYFRHGIYSEAVSYWERTCYQHMRKAACYVFIPKCDPVSQKVMHPCSEMCWDLIKGCWQEFLDVIVRLGALSRLGNYEKFSPLADKQTVINCDYLPSHYGSVPCFYKPVTCDSPPDVTNGTTILNSSQKDVYHLPDVVKYTCVNDTFEMRGNGSIRCLYNGQWSDSPPVCVSVTQMETFVLILLPILLVCLVFFLVLFLVAGIKHKRKLSHDLLEEKIHSDGILTQLTDTDDLLLDSKRKQESTLSLDSLPLLRRNRAFDAFLLYHFDTDHDFVINSLLPELE